MIKKLLAAVSVMMALTAVTVSAEEGYIFQLKEDAVILNSCTDGVESVVPSQSVYKAQSLEDVYDFADKSSIEYIGRDARVYLFDKDGDTFTEPNDLYYSKYQWNIPQINMLNVWKKGYRGKNSTVCIIDSGLYTEHYDLDKDRIKDKYNILDENSDVTDNMGHGTFVTGIISARINNGKGIAGLADKADIISLKTFDNEKDTTTSEIVAALDKAYEYDDVDVVNMSLGTKDQLEDGTKEILHNAVNRLVNKGVIIVAAVGNNGDETLSYPAAFDNVIGVGGVSENKKKCYFSQMNKSVFCCRSGRR